MASKLLITCLMLLSHWAIAQSLPLQPKSAHPLKAKVGVSLAAGMHRLVEMPPFVIFREQYWVDFELHPQTNANACLGLGLDLGKLDRHWGMRAAMGLDYMQTNFSIDFYSVRRGFFPVIGTVELRKQTLLLNLEIAMRYASLQARPWTLQVGGFLTGNLKVYDQTYVVLDNGAHHYASTYAMPPIGAFLRVGRQFPLRGIVVEPFADLRYSFRYVQYDPNATMAIAKLGLTAWLN